MIGFVKLNFGKWLVLVIKFVIDSYIEINNYNENTKLYKICLNSKFNNKIFSKREEYEILKNYKYKYMFNISSYYC
jgi:hypothetical protein